jgi:DNA primase small subunit
MRRGYKGLRANDITHRRHRSPMDPWEFAQPRFRDFYQRKRVPPPAELQRREFAFMLSGKKVMARHIGFVDEAGLSRFLAERVPAHAYYSTAYYRDPAGPTMDKKGWLGADLVFDLDADHIEGAEKMTFTEMLAAVKVEFTKLLESFILSDMGFDPAKVEVVFSGGRGYHAHVTDERVRRMTSHERREVVDYISGTGLDFDWALPKSPYDSRTFRGHVNVKYRRSFRPPDAGGWAGKLMEEMPRFLTELEGMGEEKAVVHLSELPGIGKTTARKLYADLFKGSAGRRGADRMLGERKLEVFSEEKLLNAFVSVLRERVKVGLEGEADEPVTSDVKRLIRLPGSLHAKTGFVSAPLDIETFKRFDPFADAVPATLGNSTIKLKGLKDANFKLKGEAVTVKAGLELECPEFAALFLVCSKNAEPATVA